MRTWLIWLFSLGLIPAGSVAQELPVAPPAEEAAAAVSVPARTSQPIPPPVAPSTDAVAAPADAATQPRSFTTNPLSTLAQKEKPLPVVTPVTQETAKAAPLPDDTFVATSTIEIWPVTYRPGTGSFELALGQILVSLVILALLWRNLFLADLRGRRALAAVVVASAEPAALAAHPELVGDLEARLARLERLVGRCRRRRWILRRISPEVRRVVAAGLLEPFFALLESRTRPASGRVFPLLRELLAPPGGSAAGG